MDWVGLERVGLGTLSVRELIVKLSEVEDGLRRARRSVSEHNPACVQERDLADLVHREQVIVHELRRRSRFRQQRRRPRRPRPPQ